MSAEAKRDATCHHSLLSSGLKVIRKMMMPISKTISSTIDVRRKARHAGLPVSWNRASLRPLAAPWFPAGGLGSPTSRERSEPRRHLLIPREDLDRKQDSTVLFLWRIIKFYSKRLRWTAVPFDLQPPFAAQEADAVDSLHRGWQVGQHAHVCGQRGQPKRRQWRDPAAKRTLDGTGLGRLDVDACQALQAERVFTLKHLGATEHIVELAEADGAFQVRACVLQAAGLQRGQVEVWGRDDHRNLVGGGGVSVGGRQGYWRQSWTWWPLGDHVGLTRSETQISSWEHRGGVIWWWDQSWARGNLKGSKAHNRHATVARWDEWRRRQRGWERWFMGGIIERRIQRQVSDTARIWCPVRIHKCRGHDFLSCASQTFFGPSNKREREKKKSQSISFSTMDLKE